MIIFVGDKPSAKMKPGAKPFQGAACEKRLMEWIETLIDYTTTSVGDFYLQYDIVNSSDPYCIDSVLNMWSGNNVIALGNAASNYLNKYSVPHFKLPHPSGRNRQLNDKKFIEAKLKECKEWLSSKK
jgi:uracil-DNA glycosylase